MTETFIAQDIQLLTQQLTEDLSRLYGPVLTGAALQKALGYRSGDAFRQAVCRNSVPVPLFSIPNRRGKFALAKEVASWLAEQRLLNPYEKHDDR
jgi:hypothetical protein